METYYATLMGGLGDILLVYLLQNNPSGYFKSFKEKYGDCKLKVLIISTNHHAKDILEANPYVDEVIYFPFISNYAEVSRQTAEEHKLIGIGHVTPNLTWERPDFHLNPEDQQRYNEIIALPNLVCLHPFAGGDISSWCAQKGREHVEKVVKYIVDQGFNVAILGGNFVKKENQYTFDMNENWNFNNPGIINLVNQCSIKIQCKLAANAKYFVGNGSCYSCVAAAMKKPSLLFLPEHLIQYIEPNEGGVFGAFARNDTKIFTWNQYPERPEEVIVNWLRTFF